MRLLQSSTLSDINSITLTCENRFPQEVNSWLTNFTYNHLKNIPIYTATILPETLPKLNTKQEAYRPFEIQLQQK